jgi:hypothetical protein
MPLFHFDLHDGHGIHMDPDGMLFADAAEARSHGTQVACELMRNREPRTRYWTLDVCDAGRERLFEIEFVSLDRTVHDLPPKMRESVLRLCAAFRSLTRTMSDCRMTILQSRALLAQAERKPYVIAQDGHRVEL